MPFNKAFASRCCELLGWVVFKITRSKLLLVLIALNRTVFCRPVSVVSQRDCKSNAFFWTTKTFRKIILFLFLPFNKGFAKGWQCLNTAVLVSLESGCKSTDNFCNYQMFLWKNCFKTCFCCSQAWNQGVKRLQNLKNWWIWWIWRFDGFEDLAPSPYFLVISHQPQAPKGDVRLVLCGRG